MLAETVLLFNVSVPLLKIPPPNEFAVLAEMVLLLNVSVPQLKMPPPPNAELPKTVLLFSESAPSVRNAAASGARGVRAIWVDRAAATGSRVA